MALSKHHALMAAMFIIPVVCCFIGIGAFVHVSVAAEKVEREKQAELRRQKLEELIELQKQLHALNEASEDVRKKIAAAEERIAELTNRLIQLDADSDTARVLEKETEGLSRQVAELLTRLSLLTDEVARKKKEIGKLKEETKDADSLDEKLKNLRRDLDEVQKQIDAAKSGIENLRSTLEDLRRKKGEKKYAIRSSKPRAPGALDPLFIECMPHGAIIQPEGTQLSDVPTPQDRTRFLEAAKLTGYVVFLIRPGSFGGSSKKQGSFERYRSLLIEHNKNSSQKLKFGFEPVNASWYLVYPGQEE